MDNFWINLANELINKVVIPVVLIPLALYLAKLLYGFAKQGLDWLHDKLGTSLMDKIEWVVSLAVQAAEQAGAAGLIDEKKQYAMDFAQAYLDKIGIKVDVTVLEGLIESAVKNEIKNLEGEIKSA